MGWRNVGVRLMAWSSVRKSFPSRWLCNILKRLKISGKFLSDYLDKSLNSEVKFQLTVPVQIDPASRSWNLDSGFDPDRPNSFDCFHNLPFSKNSSTTVKRNIWNQLCRTTWTNSNIHVSTMIECLIHLFIKLLLKLVTINYLDHTLCFSQQGKRKVCCSWFIMLLKLHEHL